MATKETKTTAKKKNAPKKVEEVVVETVEEVKEVVVETVEEVKEVEVVEELLSTHELQLMINEKKFVSLNPYAKRVVVENIEGGDLYVEGEAISPGQSREYKDVKRLLVTASSRPIFRVSQFI